MKLRTTLFLSLTFTFSASAQQVFNYQASANYAKAGDADTYSVVGEYFFKGVDASKGPLLAADFLDPQSKVRVGYTQQRVESEFGFFFNTSVRSSQKVETYQLGGRFVFGDQKYFVSADIARTRGTSSIEDSQTGQFETRGYLTNHNLSGGVYLSDTWTANIAYAFSNNSFSDGTIVIATEKLFGLGSDRFIGISGSVARTEVESVEFSSISGSDIEAVELGSVEVISESLESYSLGLTYYFNRHLSAGAVHNWVGDLGDVDVGSTEFSLNWFATPLLAVNAGINVRASGSTQNNFQLGITGRF